MPISVKTVRDIWDEEKLKKKAEKEIMRERKVRIIPKAVEKEYIDYLEVKEKSLAEMRKQKARKIRGFIADRETKKIKECFSMTPLKKRTTADL